MREALDANFPLFRQRGEHKVDLLNTLYRGRIYLLDCQSACPISGPRFDRAARAWAIAVCHNGVRMMTATHRRPARVVSSKRRPTGAAMSTISLGSPGTAVPPFDLSAIVLEISGGSTGPEPLHLSRAGHATGFVLFKNSASRDLGAA